MEGLLEKSLKIKSALKRDRKWLLGLEKNLRIEEVFAQAWKYLNIKGFCKKSLKVKSALKSTGKWLLGIEKYFSMSFIIFAKF